MYPTAIYFFYYKTVYAHARTVFYENIIITMCYVTKENVQKMSEQLLNSQQNLKPSITPPRTK